MKIILCDTNADVVKAWKRFCSGLDFVHIQQGSILDVACHGVVSPANSFGFMDGGVDAAYCEYFGPDLQTRVQRQIADNHSGELLVGAADIVETGNEEIPFLIMAPTMRVPMVLKDSVNAYLAARAVFLLILKGQFSGGRYNGERVADHVQIVALPGLGTGVGNIGPNTCAYQMRVALDDIVLGQYTFPQSWVEASEWHQKLYSSRIARLQYY